MADRTLADRVELLESKVENLEKLPPRVASLELHIQQFRDEVRVEFSAVRSEMRDLGETLRGEMRDLGETLRGEMGESAAALQREMRELNDQTNTHMRVLHEEVLARIGLLGEYHGPARPRRPAKALPRPKKS
jgi:hypothetical protein